MTASGLDPSTLAKAAEIGKRIGPETRSRDFGELFQVRWGSITARSSGTKTVTVEIGKETDTPIPGIIIANPSYYPRIGDEVMLALQGRGGVILGAKDAKIGHCRMWRNLAQTVSQSPTAVDTPINFNWIYDDTDTMADTVNDDIDIKWPGVYYIYGGTNFQSSTARRLLEVRLNGAGKIGPRADNANIGGATFLGSKVGFTRWFAGGDTLELLFTHFGAGAGDVLSIADDSPIFGATWIGPG